MKYDLNSTVTWRGRAVTIVGRCYVDGEWLYDLRAANGKITRYIPARLVKQ